LDNPFLTDILDEGTCLILAEAPTERFRLQCSARLLEAFKWVCPWIGWWLRGWDIMCSEWVDIGT